MGRPTTNIYSLRPHIALFATKAMLWASVSKQIDGLWVGCCDKKLSASAFCRVEEALQLIKRHDPIRYRRVVSNLDRIWINLLPGPLGQYREELKLCGLCQLSSLLGATFSCCGASRLSSFQNIERDGCPAHVVKAPCSGGNVLAHARSGAEEVPEFVVTAAISSC